MASKSCKAEKKIKKQKLNKTEIGTITLNFEKLKGRPIYEIDSYTSINSTILFSFGQCSELKNSVRTYMAARSKEKEIDIVPDDLTLFFLQSSAKNSIKE